ncbi:putative acetyl transferase protein [Janibacter sp. HTCC2649]|uniref:acetyltransferase n=1 Tax=Janibacter sp. HTCC2649 TaxID=313589 RepID=UPI0000670E73|nr:acetyltransferase [Janibacter sp. HTCC2649]EAP97397.1 putative acetyl transferase protein [Janibacter sp. HTCC2649]
MARPVVIVGCGGFGREVRDVIDACIANGEDWYFRGYVDDDPSSANLAAVERSQDEILGGVDWLENAPKDTHVFIGIGTGSVKARIDATLIRLGLSEGVLVHPTATLGRDVTIAGGSVVCAGVRMTTNIHLGRHVHVNLNTTIGHDVEIADHVSINPLVAISGNVRIGERSMIGTHAAILQGLDVGPDSIVGGSALVVRNVEESSTVKGVPAR